MKNYKFTSAAQRVEYFRETRRTIADWLGILGLTDHVAFSIHRVVEPDLQSSPGSNFSIGILYRGQLAISVCTAAPTSADPYKVVNDLVVYPTDVMLPGKIVKNDRSIAHVEFHYYIKPEFKFRPISLDTEHAATNLAYIKALPRIVASIKARLDIREEYTNEVKALSDKFVRDIEAAANKVFAGDCEPFANNIVAPCYALIGMTCTGTKRALFIPCANGDAYARLEERVKARCACMRCFIYKCDEPEVNFPNAKTYETFVTERPVEFTTQCVFDEALFDKFINIPDLDDVTRSEADTFRMYCKLTAEEPFTPAKD